MAVFIVAEAGCEGPSDLLYATTDRAMAEKVREALERVRPSYWGFYIEEVAELARDATAVTFEDKEVRLDYWCPPRIATA